METIFEATFNRIKKHFENKDCAFISACRNENSSEENNKLTQNLALDLKNLGYGFIKVKGGYVETTKNGEKVPVEEKSFVVINNNNQKFKNFPQGYYTNFKRDMIALCRKYNQDSVLIKLKNEPGHYYDKKGNSTENFNSITKEDIENYYTRLRSTKFKLIETDESDEKEEYSRYNQTFSTRVLRNLLFDELKNSYPDLFED